MKRKLKCKVNVEIYIWNLSKGTYAKLKYIVQAKQYFGRKNSLQNKCMSFSAMLYKGKMQKEILREREREREITDELKIGAQTCRSCLAKRANSPW